jgi:hypothetical protein
VYLPPPPNIVCVCERESRKHGERASGEGKKIEKGKAGRKFSKKEKKMSFFSLSLLSARAKQAYVLCADTCMCGWPEDLAPRKLYFGAKTHNAPRLNNKTVLRTPCNHHRMPHFSSVFASSRSLSLNNNTRTDDDDDDDAALSSLMPFLFTSCLACVCALYVHF